MNMQQDDNLIEAEDLKKHFCVDGGFSLFWEEGDGQSR